MAPTLAQHPPRLLGRVEHIQAVLQRRLPVLLPLLLHGGDPRLQARPRVRRDERQRSPVAQRLRPGRPRAVVGLLAEEPGHAGGLDAHQHGAAVEEDLIEAADQDQRPAPRIEGLQDASRRQPRGFDPAVQRGTTGAGLLAEDQGQQDEDLVEAQPHRRGGDGELALLARGELDGLSEPVPELGILLTEVLILLDQLGPRRSPVVRVLDGGLDLLGMIVDGLSATVGDLGLAGDIAISAGQSGRGVGDPGGEGYLEHGVGLLECGSRKQSHSGGPPPLTIKMSWPGVANCQPECGQFGSVWDGANPIARSKT